MKRKLALLLVVVVLAVLTAVTMSSCAAFGGSGGSGTGNRGTLVEDHGYAVALEISSPAESKSSAMFVDEFDISQVKAKVRFAKEIYDEELDEYKYEYWVDPDSEFSLTRDMIVDERVLTDVDLLAQNKNDVYVALESKYKDADGFTILLEGVFKLFLKERDATEYCTITFDCNGGAPLFAGTDNDGMRSVTVKKGTEFTWAEFITTYPVMPPTRQANMALLSWGSYNSSTTSIVINSDITLRAEYTQNSLQVSFDINNNSTDTLNNQTPVAPDTQTVAVGGGFVVRPKTSEMEIFNGYDFVGWYKDKAGTQLWNFTESLEKNGHTTDQNFTLYAKWEERTFTLKFNLNNSKLNDSILKAIALGTTQLGDIVPTVEKYDFSAAAYVIYTSNDNNVEFMALENKIDNATPITFKDRQIVVTDTFAAGSYSFEYEGSTYYFTAPRTFEASEKGLQIVCAPLVISYPGLKSGDSYFVSANSSAGSIIFTLGDSYLENTHAIYKGRADNSYTTYFYSFKGWYKDIANTERFDFNNGTASKKVDISDYKDSEIEKNTLYLYPKWDLNTATQETYFRDYLYKNSLTLKTDGTVRIDDVYDKSATQITVPASIMYDFGDGLQSYQVTEIGRRAFYGNSRVVQIDFASDNNITTIGDEAFAYCSNLVSIAYNKLTKVEDIGSNILRSTKVLNTFDSDPANKYLVINNILVLYTGKVEANIGGDIIKGRIDTTDLPASVHTISTGAFANLPDLLHITISQNIKVIEDLAFENCTALTIVDFPVGTQIEKVGSSAFFRTKWVNGTGYKRASVYNPSARYYIFDYEDTHDFQAAAPDETTFPSGEYYVQEEAEDGYSSLILGPIYYRYTGDTSATKTKAVIPAQVGGVSITKIAPNAFSGYSNITNIDFEQIENITTIGANAFSDTAWVSTPINAQTAEEFGSERKIVSSDGFCIINGILVEYTGEISQASPFVVIPSNVKVIAEGAFSRHDGSRIKNILFSAGITELEIEPYAFQGAVNLTDISFLGSQLPKDVVFHKESLYTANKVLNESLKIYLETDVLSLDAYITSVKNANTTWKYVETLGTEKLVIEATSINTNIIPGSYLIRSAAADSLVITDTWLESRFVRNITTLKFNDDNLGNTGTLLDTVNLAITENTNYYFTVNVSGVEKTYTFQSNINGWLYEVPTTNEVKIYTSTTIKSGVYKTYNNGVNNTEDIDLEDLKLYNSNNVEVPLKGEGLYRSWKLSATDIDSSLKQGEYYFKYYSVENSIKRTIYVYPGIDESSFTLHGLLDEYYTTQTSLSAIIAGADCYVQFNLLNGKTGLRYRLDNKNGANETYNTTECSVYIPNYSYARGSSKLLNIEITYQGFSEKNNKYNITHTYSSKVPEVSGFTQTSSFLFPINGVASNNYSNCYFDLIYEDGSHKSIAMDKGGFNITKVYSKSTHDYVEATAFDTTDLGLNTAKVTYGDLTTELTVIYCVYLGTLPEVFSYDYKMVNGEYVATITGISNDYKNSYDSTLMLPTLIEYQDHEYTVNAIGDGAFQDLTRLAAVYISNTILTIGDDAFSGCTSLRNVYTFEVAEDKTTPIVEQDDNYEYFVKPGDEKNIVEPYEETITYYSRVFIKSINYKGMEEIVIPFELEGKTGTEAVTTNIPVLDSKGYKTGDFYQYNASYKYTLIPTISYELVNDGTNTTLECILNPDTVFYGTIYLPDTEYYRTLKGLLDTYYPDDPATTDVNEGVKFTIEFYTADRKGLPSTLNKFDYSDGTDTKANWKNLNNYTIDKCYRTGSVVLLTNANIPVADDNSVYIPENYSGSYETVGYEVYYDYVLRSVQDGCYYKIIYDGAKTLYQPSSIYNAWCDVDNLLLYAQDMDTAKNNNAALSDVELIELRSVQNNTNMALVSRYQFTGGAITSKTLTYNTENNQVTGITVEYSSDVADTVANYFSSNIVSIGYNAFEGCTSLARIDFTHATSLVEIGSAAFSGCELLDNIDLSKTKIDAINANTFEGCTSLAHFKMSTTVGSIERYAFMNCAFDNAGFEVVDTEYNELKQTSLVLTDYAFYLANGVDADSIMTKFLGTGYTNRTAQQQIELANGSYYNKTYYIYENTTGLYSSVSVYYKLDDVFSRD